MADTVKIALCILWEAELRQAARLLATANSLPSGDPDEENACMAAYAACATALAGLTDDKAVVMIASDEIRKRAKSAASDGTAKR